MEVRYEYVVKNVQPRRNEFTAQKWDCVPENGSAMVQEFRWIWFTLQSASLFVVVWGMYPDTPMATPSFAVISPTQLPLSDCRRCLD